MTNKQISSKTSNQRSSNFELYRIVCMLAIICGHFIHNSGLYKEGGPMNLNPDSFHTYYLLFFGMWAKIGINCFLLITGYFMCKSTITMKKLIKFLLWIYFYDVVIFVLFYIVGYEHLTLGRMCELIMPIWGISDNFVSCFIVFWLTIPFWNILISHMTEKQHSVLVILMVFIYSICGSIPHFRITFNYVTWFGILYLIASYIRLYPHRIGGGKTQWCLCTLVSCTISIASVFIFHIFSFDEMYLVEDSNKFLALVVSISSFLWFKNINIPYNKYINLLGASTFGVLLIHANSNAMRRWLWYDTIDCIGHFSLPLILFILYSIISVLAIFFICIVIDRIRIKVLETPFFRWYDFKDRFKGISKFFENLE